MRVLVTGAAGMLGSDLIPYLRARGHQVVGIDLEVDIRDPEQVNACLAEVAPEAVIHAAAWTDVDRAEANEAAAHAVNAEGAGNVAQATARCDAALVYLSTDYVFDGTLGRDYTEDDPTAPIGAYGRTKRAGEVAVLAAHPSGARIARTAWLYGAHGRNFVDTMRSLGAERQTVQVVTDQVGSPTWTKDLAPALEAVLALPAGIYHTAAGGAVTWAGVAEAIFAETGIDCQVEPIRTAQLGRPAPRPARSVLAVTRPGAPRLRHWRAALRAYLQETA
jgi:dTDP-4-dehydrorhamnose reductase